MAQLKQVATLTADPLSREEMGLVIFFRNNFSASIDVTKF
jgi:hypothetical protein